MTMSKYSERKLFMSWLQYHMQFLVFPKEAAYVTFATAQNLRLILISLLDAKDDL